MGDQSQVKKATIIKLSLMGIFAVLIFCVFQFLDYSLLHPVSISNLAEEGQTEWQIDMVKIDVHYIAITGWAFIPNQSLDNLVISVVLQNTSTKDAYKLPTTLVTRDEIKDHYDDGIDYSQSGFLSRINRIFLELDKDTYEIYINLTQDNKNVFIKTNQILKTLGD